MALQSQISSAGVEQNASLRLKLEELDGIMGRLDARTAVKLEEDDIDPDAGIYESCVRSLPKFEPLTCAGCERAERAERGHLDFQPPELKPRGVLPAHIQEEVNWRRQHTEVLHEQISSLERQRALWEEKVRQLRGESCTSQPNKMAHLRPKSPKAQPEETRPPRQGHAFALLANEPDIASLLQNATARDVFAKLQNPQALRPIQLRQPGQVSTPELLQADVAQQRAEEARVEQQELAAAELLAKRQEMSEALQRELQDMRIMEAERQRKREQMRAQLQEELEGQLSEERKAWLVQQTQQERERQKQSQKRRLVHQELLQVELERLKDKVALKRTFQAPSAEPDCTERLEELRQVRLETDQCSRVIASASSSPLPSPLPLQVPTSTLEHGLVPRAVEVDFGEPDIAAVLETKEVGAWNLSLDAWLLYYADLLNGKSRDKVADVEVLERTFHALSFGKDRLDSETCRRALSSSRAEVAKDMLSYWVMRVQSEVAGETEKEEMPTWHKEEKGRATPPQQQRTSFEDARQIQQEASPEEAGNIGARKSAQPQQQTSSKDAQLVQQEAFSQEAGKRSNKADDSHNGKLANKQKASELTKSLYAKQADKEPQPVAQASAQQPQRTSLKDAEAPRQEAGKMGPSKADDSQNDKLATKQKASELTKSLYAKQADKEPQPVAQASAQQPPQTSLKDAEAPRQEAGKIKPSTADDSQNDKLATKQKASELTKSLYAKHADKEAQPAAHASAQPQQQTSSKDARLSQKEVSPQEAGKISAVATEKAGDSKRLDPQSGRKENEEEEEEEDHEVVTKQQWVDWFISAELDKQEQELLQDILRAYSPEQPLSPEELIAVIKKHGKKASDADKEKLKEWMEWVQDMYPQPQADSSKREASLDQQEASPQDAGKIRASKGDDSEKNKLAHKQEAAELAKSSYTKHADKEAQPATHASAQPQQRTSSKDAHLARQQAVPQEKGKDRAVASENAGDSKRSDLQGGSQREEEAAEEEEEEVFTKQQWVDWFISAELDKQEQELLQDVLRTYSPEQPLSPEELIAVIKKHGKKASAADKEKLKQWMEWVQEMDQ